MSKKAKQARKRESRLTAKIARVLADGGVECPAGVDALGALVATLPGGKNLAARVSSLSDSGLRQVQGQAEVYGREIRERREQFGFVADALNSRFGGEVKLRGLSHCGKDWTANVEVPGHEVLLDYDHEAADLEGFLERLLSEVATDVACPIILPTISPAALGTLRRKVADEAESRYLGWLAAWRARRPWGPAPATYATLGEWSDGESPCDGRYLFGEQFDEQIESEVRELLTGVVLSGIEDERYADRVRDAFFESDQAVDIESSLEEYWRSLPVPGAES
jgi:hypothetical protein